MPQHPLLKKLDEAIERVRFLEGQNDETLARATSLENEAKELRRLMAVVESKADEILKPTPSASKTSADGQSMPKSDKGLQDLVQGGASPAQADTRRRHI